MTSDDIRDDLLTDAMASMQELAEEVRRADVWTVHQSVRRWAIDRPEHVPYMLIAAACLLNPDEPLSARANRIAAVHTQRAVGDAIRQLAGTS